MAEVTGDTEWSPERADSYLSYLLAEWQGVPALAEEWTDWTEEERLSLALEWPIREDRWSALQRWAAEDRLSEDQRCRYQALETLVAQNEPRLRRLLDQTGGGSVARQAA